MINKFKRNEFADKTTWDSDTCTTDLESTDAYGEIIFLGASQNLSKVPLIFINLDEILGNLQMIS